MRFCAFNAKCRNEDHRLERRVFPAFFGLMLFCAVHIFLAPSATAQEKPTRFEVAPVFVDFHAPALTQAVNDQLALGGRFTWNWLSHLSLEGEYASTLEKPTAESLYDGGYFSQGFFGIKSGIRWRHWGVFAKFRPGLISYSGVVRAVNVSNPQPITLGRLNRAAYDLGGGAEFFLSRHWLFRYDASDVISHEGNYTVTFNGQPTSYPSITNHNFEAEVSVAFRF